MSDQEILKERYALVMDRIRKIPREELGDEKLEAYFAFCAEFLMQIDDTVNFLREGGLKSAPMEELARRNHSLYEDILPEHYEESYGNPAFAVRELGKEIGAELSLLYAELRSLISFAYEEKLEELTVRMELFAEIYTAFFYAADQGEERPSGKEIRGMIYWFASDYADTAAERRLKEQMCFEDCFAVRIILESDSEDVRFLYGYGEYISENELNRARFLAELPEETIAAMADTFTEGYRAGFEAAGVDLSGKKIVGLQYRLGFERVMRRVVANFEKTGLKSVVFRAPVSVMDNPGACRREKSGFCGGVPNRQFEYDHKDDKAIFLDRNYVNRRQEAARSAYEKWKTHTGVYAGPALPAAFGEADFHLTANKAALKLTKEQERLWMEYASKADALRQEYIPGETDFALPGCEELINALVKTNF